MTPEEFKTINDLKSKLDVEKFKPEDLYVVAESSENYHTGVTSVEYHYFILVKNIFVKLTYSQFNSILSSCGYKVSIEKFNYQYDVLNSKWKEDYEENYSIYDQEEHRLENFNPNDQDYLKVLFDKY